MQRRAVVTARCGLCGAELRPENLSGRCRECRWVERDRKLRAIEHAQYRAQRAIEDSRRRAAVQRHIRELDSGEGTA